MLPFCGTQFKQIADTQCFARHTFRDLLYRFGNIFKINFAVQRNVSIFAIPKQKYGALAERLGTGLQNLLERFDSARHLQKISPKLL